MTALKYLFLTMLLIGFSGLSMASNVVATVNGKKITQKQFDRYLRFRQSFTKQNISGKKLEVLQDLINHELLMAEVKKKKIDKNKDLNYLIEQQNRDIYIKALLRDTDVAKPVTDDEIKKIYDANVGSKKVKEFKLSSILLKTEQEAKDVIAALDGGGKFEDLAKKKSIGPTAKKGGELGWISGPQLNETPGIAQAVSELKKGSYAKKPVKTRYGWHVIKLDDEKEVQPPTMEQVRKQIVTAIRQKRFQQYVDSLRKSAKIKIKMK